MEETEERRTATESTATFECQHRRQTSIRLAQPNFEEELPNHPIQHPLQKKISYCLKIIKNN